MMIIDWVLLIGGVAVVCLLTAAIVHSIFEILRHDAEDREGGQ